MEYPVQAADLYATKGVEYLLVIGFIAALYLFWRLVSEPASADAAAPSGSSDQAGGGRLRWVLSLAGSLLYVLFFPVIGVGILLWIIVRRLLPGRRPAVLGTVLQDGGEPLDGAVGGKAGDPDDGADHARSPEDKEET